MPSSGFPTLSFEDLIARSEVLSLHIPLDHTTRELYSAAFLARMRDDAVLITCHGSIIDEEALKEQLLDGRLATACIDAFAVEPPAEDELLDAEFLCTPLAVAQKKQGSPWAEPLLTVSKTISYPNQACFRLPDNPQIGV